MQSNNSKNNKISAIVLAGGKSTRMGQDKALVEFEGEYMIQRIVRQLQEHFDEIIVTTGEAKRYESLLKNVIVLEDEIKDCGPMGGLYTGLKAVSNEYSFVTACDMPFLSPAFVQFLIAQIDRKADAIVAEVGGIKCVTRAIYGKMCLGAIKTLVDQGYFSLQALVDSVNSVILFEGKISEIDRDLLNLHTFNTTKEWALLNKTVIKNQ